MMSWMSWKKSTSRQRSGKGAIRKRLPLQITYKLYAEFDEFGKLYVEFDELDKLHAEFDKLHKLNSKLDELDKL